MSETTTPISDHPPAAEPSNSRAKPHGNERALKKNRNRMTHGVRGWLCIGSLPPGASYVRRVVGEFRRQIEAAVLAIHGELTPYANALCQTAARHEGRALLAGRWLKQNPEIALSERLALLNTISAASDARDRCLEKLGLDRLPNELDPWVALKQSAAAATGAGGDDA